VVEESLKKIKCEDPVPSHNTGSATYHSHDVSVSHGSCRGASSVPRRDQAHQKYAVRDKGVQEAGDNKVKPCSRE
jgi:hypothetical protein